MMEKFDDESLKPLIQKVINEDADILKALAEFTPSDESTDEPNPESADR